MNKLHYLFIILIATTAIFPSCNEDEGIEIPPEVISTGEFVDLRPRQSALKSQGDRSTCIVFAAVAALEAAYIRQGMGELDLSEEFINFTGKSFFLEPRWDVVEARGEDALETQLGSSGGGGGTGVVAILKKGFRIPEETVMPYRSSDDYYKNNFQSLRDVIAKKDAGEIIKQRDYSNFNLDPTILSNEQLRATKYYSVGQYRDIADPRDPTQIEKILKRDMEVVWDFVGAAPWSEGGMNAQNIWQKCNSCDTIAHSMLIVGFDKRDPDPANHYFIVKNSWNSNKAVDGDGFTYISYEYLKNYGASANYILMANAPAEWPELAFVGRWSMSFDGHKGELDIYHLPGLNQHTFEYFHQVGEIPEVYTDYRIGTFYGPDGKAFKVNGSVEGNRIEFYFHIEKPLQRWDEKLGRKFVYYLDGNNFMAGMHTDGDGRTYAGYARKAEHLAGGRSRTPRPFSDLSYLDSQWDFYSETGTGAINFHTNYTNEFEDFFLVGGTFTPSDGGASSDVQIKIPREKTNEVYIQIGNLGGSAGSFIGKHLGWEAGLVTGHSPETGFSLPFYMSRQ